MTGAIFGWGIGPATITAVVAASLAGACVAMARVTEGVGQHLEATYVDADLRPESHDHSRPDARNPGRGGHRQLEDARPTGANLRAISTDDRARFAAEAAVEFASMVRGAVPAHVADSTDDGELDSEFVPLNASAEMDRLVTRESARVAGLRAELRRLSVARRAVRLAAKHISREINGQSGAGDEVDTALLAVLRLEDIGGLRENELRDLRHDFSAIRREADRQHRRAMSMPYTPTTSRTLNAARAALHDWLDELRDTALDHLRRRSREIIRQFREHRALLDGLQSAQQALRQPAPARWPRLRAA